MNVAFKWKEGLDFTCIKQFKGAIKEWYLLNERDHTMRSDDKLRCKVKCMARKCGCLYFVSKVETSETYKLKTLIGKYTCMKIVKGYLASFD